MRLKAKRPTDTPTSKDHHSVFRRFHNRDLPTATAELHTPPPRTPPSALTQDATPSHCPVGRRNSAPPVPLSPDVFTPDIYTDDTDKGFCPRLKSCVKAHEILERKNSAPIQDVMTPARAWRQHLESVLMRGPISRPDISVLITAEDMSSDDSTQNSESECPEVFETVCPVSPKSAVKFRVNEQALEESPRRARSEGKSLRERLRLRRKKTGFMFNPDASDEQKQELAQSYRKGVEEFKKRDIIKAKFGSWKRKGSITAQSDYALSTPAV